jgi:hypothetical protein
VKRLCLELRARDFAVGRACESCAFAGRGVCAGGGLQSPEIPFWRGGGLVKLRRVQHRQRSGALGIRQCLCLYASSDLQGRQRRTLVIPHATLGQTMDHPLGAVTLVTTTADATNLEA